MESASSFQHSQASSECPYCYHLPSFSPSRASGRSLDQIQQNQSFRSKLGLLIANFFLKFCCRPRPLRGHCLGCDGNDFEHFHRAYIVSMHRVSRMPARAQILGSSPSLNFHAACGDGAWKAYLRYSLRHSRRCSDRRRCHFYQEPEL